MGSVFSAYDLTAAGLALDICGAAIVVRGLFQSEREIAELAQTDLRINLSQLTMGSFGDRFRVGHPTLLLSRVEDRVDGAIGVGMLVLGFLLQAVATMLFTDDHGGSRGTSAFWLALGLMAVTALIALGAYRLIRRPVIGKQLERVLAQPGVHPHFADACRHMYRDPAVRDRPTWTRCRDLALGIEQRARRSASAVARAPHATHRHSARRGQLAVARGPAVRLE